MFDGYILVGGKSSRMKTNKAALRLGNFTFAERAFESLKKVIDGRISFVIGANQTGESLPLDVSRITDIFPDKAALGGIYTALAHSTNEWAVILACDYPFATENLFVRLAEITGAVEERVYVVVPIQPDGRPQPLCAFYRVENCLAIVEQLLKSDKIPPVRRVFEKVATLRVQFEELADLPGAENFFANINKPEDFRRALSIYQRSQNS